MIALNSASTLLHSPLKHIDTQFRDLAKEFDGLDIKEFINVKCNAKTLLKDELTATKDQIPNLNSLETFEELSELNGCVVTFLGYVQDMFDPEMQVTGLLKPKTQPPKTMTELVENNGLMFSKYRDFPPDFEISDISFEDNAVFLERHRVLAISTPGMQDWGKKIFFKNQSNTESTKDTLRVSEVMEKVIKSKEFPKGYKVLVNEKSLPVLLKFYEKDLTEPIKLNCVYQFTGILEYTKDSYERLLKEDNLVGTSKTEESFDPEFAFPQKIVPRLHVLQQQSFESLNLVNIFNFEKKINHESAYKKLISLFTTITRSAEISELLLYSLLSTIITRRSFEMVGKFYLNLYNANQEVQFNKTSSSIRANRVIIDLIRELCLFVSSIELTRRSLEEMDLIPEKNYELNLLNRGCFQIPKGSVLCIDETGMDTGLLNKKGTENVQHLTDLINEQKFICNFQYYQTTINTDVKVLSLSKEKSLMKTHMKIKLPDEKRVIKEDDEINSVLEGKAESLEELRGYLLSVEKQISNIKLEKEVSEKIQTTFIEECKNKKSPLDGDALNLRLTLCKIKAACLNLEQITYETYESIVKLSSTK